MRFGLSLAVLGVACLTSGASMAQSVPGDQGYVYGGAYSSAPMYNSGGYRGPETGAPMYNSGANLQMLPAPVAGKDAPSYSYSHRATGQPDYNAQMAGNMGGGALSPDQARAVRMQREASAAAYQQQYLANKSQQEGANPYAAAKGSQYQGNKFGQLYVSSDQAKPPTKKKVVYKQMNNPLTEPPRLFNVEK